MFLWDELSILLSVSLTLLTVLLYGRYSGVFLCILIFYCIYYFFNCMGFFLLFIEMLWINCNCYCFIKSCEDMEFTWILIKKIAWIRRRFLQVGTCCRVRKKEEEEEKQVKESLPRAESRCSSPSSFTRSGGPHESKSEDPEAEARKHVAFSFRFFFLIFCAGWGAATSSLLPDSDEGVGGEADPLRQQLQQSHPVVQTEGADKTHTFKHTHEQTLSHTYIQQRSKI